LQMFEAEEPAGSLDGVDGAEGAREDFLRGGILLERDEITIELIEILVALDQELPDDVVAGRIHPRSVAIKPASLARGWASPVRAGTRNQPEHASVRSAAIPQKAGHVRTPAFRWPRSNYRRVRGRALGCVIAEQRERAVSALN